MLANCCAVNPVSPRMVGASAASMVRWKNESHEHAAIAKHGTHICQVTAARSAVAVPATVFTPVVVDINFSSVILGAHPPNSGCGPRIRGAPPEFCVPGITLPVQPCLRYR